MGSIVAPVIPEQSLPLELKFISTQNVFLIKKFWEGRFTLQKGVVFKSRLFEGCVIIEGFCLNEL